MILLALNGSKASSPIYGLIDGVCYFGGYGRGADYKKAYEVFTIYA